jgi:hypothetical protein
LKLLQSLDTTGGYEQLMSLLYNATSVTNGFNSIGHYARAEPLNSSNTPFFTTTCGGVCAGKFQSDAESAAAATRSQQIQQQVVSRALSAVGRDTTSSTAIGGLLSYLTGGRK